MKFISLSLFVILAIIGCAIFVGTFIVFLIHNRISFLGDIDVTSFGQFGEFLGGVVGTIFSIMATVLLWFTYKNQKQEMSDTKALTIRQINLGFKPDLFLSDTSLYGFAKISKNGVAFPLIISKNDISIEEKAVYPSINLVNIGVGAAKYITYKWNYNVDEMVVFAKKLLGDSTVIINLKNHFVQIGLDDQTALYNCTTDTQSFDILLPYKDTDNAREILIPQPFLLLYFLSLQLKIISGISLSEDFKLNSFPICILAITYLDLADNQHSKTFRVEIGNLSFWSSARENGQPIFQSLAKAKVITI